MENKNEECNIQWIEGIYKIGKRGRSLQLTVPPELAELLSLKKGDSVKFLFDKKKEFGLIVNKKRVKGKLIHFEGLDIEYKMEIPLKKAEKIIEKMKKCD